MITPALTKTWRYALGEPVVIRWLVISRLTTFGCFLALYLLGPMGRLDASWYGTPGALLGAWDGAWYARVAEHGYLLIPGHQSDPAFFPLFPILMRGLHACGLPFTAAGVVIANAAFAVAIVGFYHLGCRLLPEPIARRGAVFLAVTPMGFVFSMAYPESLLLAFVVLAALAALDGRWLGAAVFAALAVLTRPEGLLLAIPLAAIAWRQRGALDPGARGRAVAAVLAAPTALLAFLLYLKWSLDDLLAWNKAEQPWGRAFRLDGVLRTVEHLPRLLGGEPLLARDALFVAINATLLVVAAVRTSLPREWIVAGALVLLLPLFSGTVESEGRFGLLALPVYWGAGSLPLGRIQERVARVASLALLGAGVLMIPFIWP